MQRTTQVIAPPCATRPLPLRARPAEPWIVTRKCQILNQAGLPGAFSPQDGFYKGFAEMVAGPILSAVAVNIGESTSSASGVEHV
jgi:hypothetical protein